MIILIPRNMRQLKFYVVLYSILFAVGFAYIKWDEYQLSLLNHFQTREELIRFLESDRTDNIKWSPEFVCEDFANTLIANAKEQGYRIDYHSIESYELSEYRALLQEKNYDIELSGTEGHALCKAFIVDEDRWVMIEPQNDLIFNVVIG